MGHVIRVAQCVEIIAHVQQSPSIFMIRQVEDLAMLSCHRRQPLITRLGVVAGPQAATERFCYRATHSKCDCAGRKLAKEFSALGKFRLTHLWFSCWVG